MKDDFLVVCLPAESHLRALGVATGYGSTPTLVTAANAVLGLLRAPDDQDGVRLEWPPVGGAVGGSLFVYSTGQPNQLVVPTTANCLALFAPNRDLLLFLRDAPETDTILLPNPVVPPGRVFRRADVIKAPFSLPDSLLTDLSSLRGRVYFAVGGLPPAGHSAFPVVVGPTNGATPLAVLNPVILRVRLEGNGLREPGGGVTVPVALRLLFDASRDPSSESLFHVEPVAGAEEDARVAALADLSPRMGAGCAVGSLLFGGASGTPDWLPFLCLDALGGRFRLEGAGGRGGKQWCHGESPAPNRRWFAEYWRERWQGQAGPDGSAWATFENADAGEISRRPAQIRERTNIYADPPLRDCADFLQRLPSPSAVLHCFHRLLERHPRLRQAFADAHLRFVKVLPSGEVRASFARLEEWIGEACFLPHSPVSVQLPEATTIAEAELAAEYLQAIDGRSLDFRSSVLWPGRRFAECALGAVPGPEPGRIVFRDGWWLEWYRRLFAPGEVPTLTFGAEVEGFVIGRSILGRAPLGRGAAPFHQPADVKF